MPEIQTRNLTTAPSNQTIISLLSEMMLIDSPSSLTGMLDRMRNDDPSTLVLAEELLSSGSHNARRVAAGYLSASIAAASEAITTQDEATITTPADEDEYYEWGTTLQSSLIKAWCVGAVCFESEIAPYDSEQEDVILDLVRWTHDEITENDVQHRHSMDRAYWRGITALVLADPTGFVSRKSAGGSVPFILWAGAHENIGAVIKLSTERQTIDPEHIEAVLNQMDFTSPVREGLL